VWSADRDRGVEGEDETTNILNSFKKGFIGILQCIRINLGTSTDGNQRFHSL